MAVLHLKNCLKSHPLAQQCTQCGPCPMSLLPTWLLREQSPKAHPAWCDTPAMLGLARSQGTSESGHFQLRDLCVVV